MADSHGDRSQLGSHIEVTRGSTKSELDPQILVTHGRATRETTSVIMAIDRNYRSELVGRMMQDQWKSFEKLLSILREDIIKLTRGIV